MLALAVAKSISALAMAQCMRSYYVYSVSIRMYVLLNLCTITCTVEPL